MANSLLPAHRDLKRRLKFLASGNHQRQQIAENTLRRMENGLARALRTAKNDFIAQCAEAYRNHKERDFHTQLMDHRMVVNMLLTKQAQQVIPRFGKGTLDDIRASLKSRNARFERKSKDDSLFARLIQQWLQQRRSMSANIAQTTLNDVLNAVQDGIDDGAGTDEIARAIQGVTSFSPFRSQTAARTETHAAALFAQIETGRQAERDYGIQLVKEWLPTLDNRTRDTHAAMADYGAIPLDEKFIVGGYEMDRPGDPSAPPSEVVNCRCTLVQRQA